MVNHCLRKKYHRLTPWLLLLVFFGHWLTEQLIYMAPQNDHDTDVIPMLNQLHKALGKDKHRVAYQIIATKGALKQHPSAKEVFNLVLLAPGEIALIDPRGWLMMHYPANPDPIGMLKDIRRLLRYSHG